MDTDTQAALDDLEQQILFVQDQLETLEEAAEGNNNSGLHVIGLQMEALNDMLAALQLAQNLLAELRDIHGD